MSSPDAPFRPTEDVLAGVRAEAMQRVTGSRRRRRVGAGLGVATVVVAAAIAVAVVGGDDGGDRQRTTGVSTPTTTAPSTTVPGPAPGTSLPMDRGQLSARSDAITAWTGTELIVWRGMGQTTDVCTGVDGGVVCGDPARTDGARYDPATDAWRPMADSPMPAEATSSFRSTVGVWTGTELVVWGGPGPDAAAYDPASDTWRTLDPGPLEARNGAAAVWTGNEMVVVGGVRRTPFGRSGGAPLAAAVLDPASGTWRTVEAPGGDALAETHAAWTGTSVVVQTSLPDQDVSLATLDVDSGEWTQLPRPPLIDGSSVSVVDGGGEQYLVVTGGDPDAPFDLVVASIALGAGAGEDWATATLDGDRYWQDLWAVAGDGKLYLAVGSGIVAHGDPDPMVAVAVDPASGAIVGLDLGLTARDGPAAGWTGSELLVWGGGRSGGYGNQPLGDGVRYRPPG